MKLWRTEKTGKDSGDTLHKMAEDTCFLKPKILKGIEEKI